ncbi:MAG TPA: LytTR family DNA-binding domain-containing protein [Bacteroidales bacterium]|nr:LytTR family DNA-binding domain-containing protein [Bacteroidales bacterium]
MIKIKALVIDDEEHARRLLHRLLDELQCFDEIHTAASAAVAAKELKNFTPDMIFLDVEMPGKDGFTFLSDFPLMEKKPCIVIVSAYDQFAMKAIKSHAFDYLLKPVDRRELKSCVEKFLESRKPAVKDSPDKFSRIRINTRTGVIFINPATILYCKAEGNYSVICTGEKQHLCSVNLGKIEELLTENSFLRVGRSYIINREYITMLDRKESVIVLSREGETVKVQIPRHHLRDIDNL